MAERITDGEDHALSQLRYLIRRFLQQGDATARQAGLEAPQCVWVSLQRRGGKVLEKVGAQRVVELRSHGRALVGSIGKLLESRSIGVRQKKRSGRSFGEN